MVDPGGVSLVRAQGLALFVALVLVVVTAVAAAGCRPRPSAQDPGAPPAAAPAGDAFARVQKIEGSAEYRAAVERFIAERRKADPILRDLALDTPSILRAVVPETWVAQPEEAREQWALDLAAGFRQVRTEAGIPTDDPFLPMVKVFLADGGVVAEVWRHRTRHYR